MFKVISLLHSADGLQNAEFRLRDKRVPKSNVTAVLTHSSRAIVAVGTADGFTYVWDYSTINDIASETTGGGGLCNP